MTTDMDVWSGIGRLAALAEKFTVTPTTIAILILEYRDDRWGTTGIDSFH